MTTNTVAKASRTPHAVSRVRRRFADSRARADQRLNAVNDVDHITAALRFQFFS